MSSKKRSYNRVKKYRWISVDLNEKIHLRGKEKKVYKELTNLNVEIEDTLDDGLDSVLLQPPPTSKLLPPNYNFSKSPRKPCKYYCPYYISPKNWNNYTKTPLKTEKQEIERFKNFYYHMHEADQSSTSIKSQPSNSTLQTLSQELSVLPPIQKYKQYLISKSLRLPSFLNSTYTS